MSDQKQDPAKALNDHADAVASLHQAAAALKRRAGAAHVLGMSELGNLLDGIAGDVVWATHAASDAFRLEWNNHYNSIQQGSDNMIRATFAAIDAVKQ